MDEKQTEESQAIYHILGIFEHLVDAKASIAETLFQKTKLLSWLLSRVKTSAEMDDVKL